MALSLPYPDASAGPASSLPAAALPGTALEAFPQRVAMEDDATDPAPSESPAETHGAITGRGAATVSIPRGVPLSSAAPQALTGHLDAEEIRRRAEREKQAWEWSRWRSGARAKVYALAMGDEGAWQEVDTSGDEDQARARREVLVDSYLRIAIDGAPLPDTPLGRDLLRSQVAHRRFKGRGADSDGDFQKELGEEAIAWGHRTAFSREIAARATRSALPGDADGTGAADWITFRNEARAHPGYRPEDEPDHYQAWQDAHAEAQHRVAPFLTQLSSVRHPCIPGSRRRGKHRSWIRWRRPPPRRDSTAGFPRSSGCHSWERWVFSPIRCLRMTGSTFWRISRSRHPPWPRRRIRRRSMASWRSCGASRRASTALPRRWSLRRS
jgi:hypothetical protein